MEMFHSVQGYLQQQTPTWSKDFVAFIRALARQENVPVSRQLCQQGSLDRAERNPGEDFPSQFQDSAEPILSPSASLS